MSQYSLDFPFAFDKPSQQAIFRKTPDDFIVEEIMDDELTGMGEHFWLKIKKRGENTDWVAKKLANFFSVRKLDVGYGGKKDRHAVTTQWFSVYLPGKSHEIDWQAFLSMADIDAELLMQKSHERKLKIGHHDANHFRITLHNIHKTENLESRLESVKRFGVPNYFGPQRFGRDGGNLLKVEKWVKDSRSIRDRNQRGIIISSARSFLFNKVLAERVLNESWTNSIPEDLGEGEITGPLWGRGLSLAKGELLDLESRVLEAYASWTLALENVGLSQERRALCLRPKDFKYHFEQTSLIVEFTLGAGQYATSVLREIALLEEQQRDSRG